jgi:hypothetical protein
MRLMPKAPLVVGRGSWGSSAPSHSRAGRGRPDAARDDGNRPVAARLAQWLAQRQHARIG